jgi:DNA-binding transcriptional MerR regulator
MSTDSYDLLELCDAADVTPRTVRYYVQQGLLPSPDTRGRGARYDRAHLDRIRLIKRLQGRHLPLSEIRAQLAELSDAAVSALVADPAASEKSESALDYVRNVLSGTNNRPQHGAPKRTVASSFGASMSSEQMPIPKVRAREIGAAPGTASESASASFPIPAPAPALAAPAQASSAAPPETSTQSRSTWDRVPLTADIELHIRRPLSRVQNRLLDRLLEHARSLFSDQS